MCRLFAFMLVVSCSVAFAPAAPVPAHLQKQPVYYFPTKVGTKLVYKEPSRELTMVVTAVRDHGATKIVSVGRVASDDSVTSVMTVTVTGSGLYRTERRGCKLDTPELWLRLPAEPDSTWDYPTGDPTILPRAKVFNTIVGTEDVTVPAGTFRAVRVHSLQGERTVTSWYAPDVGLVKLEAATWEEVLKSFTPAKD